MSSRLALRVLSSAVLLLPLAGAAHALGDPLPGRSGDPIGPSVWSALQEEPSDSWTWRIAPYLWAAGIQGDLSTGVGDADFDFDFVDDIWDNLEGAGLLLVEARKGQFSILGDVIYLGLEPDGKTPTGADAGGDIDTTILELVGLYRLSPMSSYEVGVGIRYVEMSVDVDLGMVNVDGDADAFDGFVAGRAAWPFAERWSAAVYGDIGAGDSDLTWQASAMLGFHFTHWGLGLGYRALGYEFEDGSNEVDFAMHGPVFGAEFRF